MKFKSAKHSAGVFAAVFLLLMVAAPAVLAAEIPEPPQVSACYPTTVTRSEDGREIKKMYDLSPEDDPAGIPRSDFEQDGFHYTLIDLLKQEMPEVENRQHTETVSIADLPHT